MSESEKKPTENKSSETEGAKKKPYAPPVLKKYGAIERYTGGGSGTRQEGFMMRTNRFP